MKKQKNNIFINAAQPIKTKEPYMVLLLADVVVPAVSQVFKYAYHM